MQRGLLILAMTIAFGASSAGQTPRPFPVPAAPAPPQTPAPPRSAPAPQPTPQPAPQPSAAAAAAPAQGDPVAPDPVAVWFPVYPAAQFIASFDAGRGQRYYVYGVTASFVDVVTYYRTQLKERGDLVFEQPQTHMFEVGRYRQETMAFPPGVTVKDWTSGGSQGYPNPRASAQPARFPTTLMVVPPPAGAAQ